LEINGIEYRTALELVCNQSKQFIDDYAQRAADRLLEPGGDIIELVDKLGGVVHYVSILEASLDTETIRVWGPRQFEILLPEHTTPRRDRFTIAHELGHYFLHSWSGQRPMKATRSGSDRAEWEANWFAAGFLMPERKFREAHKEKQSLSWLANRFEVSENAAQIRCKVLNLEV
jgi:Zn-dependent peptidase ImmA (M78 family)